MREQYGKQPPSDKDLERAVLGCILLEQDAQNEAFDILKHSGVFYDADNVLIYDAMMYLLKKGSPVDIITVVTHLNEVGKLQSAAFKVTELTKDVVNTAHIATYCYKLYELFMKREYIRIGYEMVSKSMDGTTDAFDISTGAEKQLHDILNDVATGQTSHIAAGVKEVLDSSEKMRLFNGDINGLSLKHSELDRLLSGLAEDTLTILAARPSVGKTAFILDVALNAATTQNMTGAIFSLEMSKKQLVRRMMANMLSIDYGLINSPQKMNPVVFDTFVKEAYKVSELPIYIDDTASLNIYQLRARAKKLKAKHDIDYIMIDYLQLMTGIEKRNGNREQEISTISRELKILAKELKIPIIALSQMNRAIESRAESEPKLADLRESGAIEQDADNVIFLYKATAQLIADGLAMDGDRVVFVAKAREGNVDKVVTGFNGMYQRFTSKADVTNTMPPPDHASPYAGMQNNVQGLYKEGETPFGN